MMELARALSEVTDEQREELLRLYADLAVVALSKDAGAAVVVMDRRGDGRGQVAVIGNSFLVRPLLDSAHEAIGAYDAQYMRVVQ